MDDPESDPSLHTQKLLQTLLANGMCDAPGDCDIPTLSKLLGPLSYEPVLLPYRKVIVLRDLYTQGVSAPWREHFIDRAREIFAELAHGKLVNSTDQAADLLVDNKWLTRSPDGTLHFTERSLVQFSDIILSSGGTYRKCQLCGFLCNGEYHAECKAILSWKS